MRDPKQNPRIAAEDARALEQLTPEHIHVHMPVVPAEPEPVVEPTPPRVPPWVTDLAKWGSLDRATRRRLERHHAKQQRRR